MTASDYMQRVLLAANQFEARALLGIPTISATQTPWLQDVDSGGFKLTGDNGATYLQLSSGVSLFDNVGYGVNFYTGGGEFNFSGGLIDVGGQYVSSLHDPSNPQDAATKAYVDAHMTPLTPWTSDIDSAGHKLTGDSGSTTLQLNGGYVIAKPSVQVGDYYTISSHEDFIGSTYDWFAISPIAANNSALVVDTPIANESAITLRDLNDNVSNNGIVFFSGAGTYDMGIAVAGVGAIWNCTAGTGIMAFTAPQHYFGSSSDDGTSARIQITSDAGSGIPALSVDGSVGQTTDYTIVAGDILHFSGGVLIGIN